MDLTYISLEKKDRVAIAWMNKPKANTYDADLMRDLNTMIDDVRFDDEVDVCVIASKLDGVWSAGADINLLASSTPEYKAMFCLNCQETLNKMESTPKLFIAAIDGHCVGGGLEKRIVEGPEARPVGLVVRLGRLPRVPPRDVGQRPLGDHAHLPRVRQGQRELDGLLVRDVHRRLERVEAPTFDRVARGLAVAAVADVPGPAAFARALEGLDDLALA